ncbi:variant erythrocyte surface antigen-1 family protein [Babesia caballi]|uniref:Variant erythrocyte surface antigen-1 family protein n=1 Tax=Babesia caballi TaxID=5871 RepID=A0AAV4LYA9_BABCB|nr:variant erythrocyte surface antigen-1 family protein [Babesia caballi]
MGCGKTGFEDALDTVATQLGQVSVNLSNGIKEVLEKVKDVTQLKSKSDVQQLANGFKNYFNGVLGKVEEDSEIKKANQAKNHIGTLKSNLATLVTNVGSQKDDHPINVGQSSSNGQSNGLKSDIDTIYAGGSGTLTQLRKAFISLPQKTASFALSAASHTATTAFVTVLQTDYTSYYKGATWENDSDKPHKCVQIFLACLPLIFNGLSYFYWKCSDQNGWKDMTLGSPEPKAFMGLMSIGANRVKSGRKGAEILSQGFQNFKEFTTAASSGQSYADFLNKFRDNCITTWQSSSTAATDSTFLSGLYLCSTSYFRHQHQKKAATARAPSSIREMLYWLMGLTATPQFGDLLGHIDNVIGPDFKVAVSGSSTQNETLSADQVTSYILSTCYTSPSVLNIIQGYVPPNLSGDEPWLHGLYNNTEFPLKYPSSGAALFYALADYTYALQFQLSFLYKQCQDMSTTTCGWQFCTFGKDVNKSLTDNVLPSHICPTGCTTGSKHNDGDHAKGDCQHAGCGKQPNKASPLQAFLTDRLKGFSRGHPSYPSSHLATCSGSLCHVPMGFKTEHLRPGNSSQGGHISLTLKPFCGSSTTPLRQLCGTLTCLSKRAPRALGDWFGFYLQVTGQLFNDVKNQDNDPSSKLKGAISSLLNKLTTVKSGLLYESLSTTVETIGRHFFGLSWHCHKKSAWKTEERKNSSPYCDDHSDSKKACDLMSLYDSECIEHGATCGKYLEPLGISSGATFANNYAFMYLSWAAYFTDDLYESLREFFEKFKGHACKGCNHGCSHSSTSQCSCPSIVDCADVLPHLYANGFSFHNAYWLRGRDYTGGKWQENSNKRNCANFHDQLQAVISGNPLASLLTSIDELLYLFRYYFLSNLSAFWTTYTCLILYTFFFLLDTLQLRSHLKLTSSHTVPPLALLTSGTPLPITKLTYITQ